MGSNEEMKLYTGFLLEMDDGELQGALISGKESTLEQTTQPQANCTYCQPILGRSFNCVALSDE